MLQALLAVLNRDYNKHQGQTERFCVASGVGDVKRLDIDMVVEKDLLGV